MKKIFYLFLAVMVVMLAHTVWAANTANTANIEDTGDARDARYAKKNTVKIRKIMDEQVNAWNQGNFEGFMAGYWKSENLTFQSGNTRRKGWETLLAMYKKNYAGENRGNLEFIDIEMKILTKGLILVLGRWKVTTKEKTKQGLFTLVFRRIGNEWKIIHDHSS